MPSLSCKEALSLIQSLKDTIHQFDTDFTHEKDPKLSKKEAIPLLRSLKQTQKTIQKDIENLKDSLGLLFAKPIIEKERQNLIAFFGEEKAKTFEIPPLPPFITKERVEKWKTQGFELRFLPKVTFKESDTFPGWKKKPNLGLNLFKQETLGSIANVPKNQSNPNLKDSQGKSLNPLALTGNWMLIDTRPKPNFDNGNQTYEKDSEIQAIIKKLSQQGTITDSNCADGRRNKIHPKNFSKKGFWKPFKKYFGISQDEQIIIRLPRIIEQNFLGQKLDWDGTSTWEWAEEYYKADRRLISGYSRDGGASNVYWNDYPIGRIGFRPSVVFSV